MDHPRVLLLSMYPLDQGLWGPTVRITHLRDALARRVAIDVVDGYRAQRRGALARYALSGQMRALDGMYVETSTALPSETDVAFLALARALGVPILTYFRDAYQLFPEYYSADTPRRWLSARAFLPAMRTLASVSSRVAVPSNGLGRAIFGDRRDFLTLAPGSPPPAGVAMREDADQLLFIGNARGDAAGGRRLLDAVSLAREAGSSVELTLVCRVGEEPDGELPAAVRIVRAEGTQVHALLPNVMATIIPRPKNRYNDLALPVKLFDYLSFGRPLIVTNCAETARVVRDARCGLVVGDAPAEIAHGIRELGDRPFATRRRLGDAAARSAIGQSWEARATQVLDALGLGPLPERTATTPA